MVKTNKNSRIEIWGSNYINDLSLRDVKDQIAVILQIERGIDSDYIVEVVDPFYFKMD